MRLPSERHSLILAAVRRRGTVRLTDLIDDVQVSAVTLRRDVTALAEQGLLVRVHGGIALPPSGRGTSPEVRALDGADRRPVDGVVLGMVVPSTEYYWPSVVRGAQQAAVQQGVRLALRGSRYDHAEDRRQVEALLEHGIAALVVAPTLTGPEGPAMVDWLAGLDVPVCLAERTPPLESATVALDAVSTDHALGAGLAVRHLAELGHRRVGLVTSRPSPTSHAVRRGWIDTTAALGLGVDGVPDCDVPDYGNPGWTTAYDEVLDMCRAAGVDALLVHADREAIGIVERAGDRGLRVPDDLAVVSYDDELGAMADPPLTAVRPDKHRLGVVAVKLALDRCAEPDRPVHRVMLWPTLVPRASSRHLST